MLKTLGQFEVEISGKIGRFTLDHDTPIHVAKSMCFEFIKMIGRIEDAAKAAEDAAKAAETPPEVAPIETPQETPNE